MNSVSWILVAIAVVMMVIFFSPRVRTSKLWHAITIPLASIIGSGILLAGPLLAATVGGWALWAMAALVLTGYAFGSAIRYNIVHLEPQLHQGAPASLRAMENISELVLALAYFVSIAYYINLFAAFGLRALGITDSVAINSAATVVIAAITAAGAFWGFSALEKLVLTSVTIKLALVVALVVALSLGFLLGPSSELASLVGASEVEFADLRVLLGLVILVQGFETSRYLGDEFDAPTRVRSMRFAQIISGVIYLLFIAAASPYFGDASTEALSETAVIDMLSVAGLIFAPVLIATALTSQFSAAVADTSGAAGLLVENTKRRLSTRSAIMVIGAVAIALTWSVSIFTIVVLGSQAFVVYYALQSITAARQAYLRGKLLPATLFTLLGVFGVLIVIFAIPAA
jgi:hypothetical protein